MPQSRQKVQINAVLPEAGLINGLITLNSRTILASDGRSGITYSINIKPRAHKVAIYRRSPGYSRPVSVVS